jgi:molybdopterin biosynthesis enzyme
MTYGAYSCYRDTSGGSSSGIDEAFAWIISLADPVRGEETVPLAVSLGRVTTHDIITTRPLPRFDQAAIDAFGLSDGDLARPAPFDLPVVGRV